VAEGVETVAQGRRMSAVRLAVLVERLGPYHASRFQALSRRLGPGQLAPIEVAGQSRRYAWDGVTFGGVRVTRLFPEADYPDLGARKIGKAVQAALDALAPESVAVNGWGFPEARAAVGWARARGRAVVLMSDSQERDARRTWLKERAKRVVVGRCDSALVAGQRHAAYAAKLGMPASGIVLGYDVVDNEHFARGAAVAREHAHELRVRLGLPDRYWLLCARFVPKKNLGTALEAFANYQRELGSQAWGLVLLGDGPLRGELAARTASLGLAGRIVMPGFVQYPDLPQYYGLASAFVLPSLVEQWGLVVNEAMAASLPVLVSTACGCAPDLVQEGVNGFTFEPSDPGRLALLMARLSQSGDLPAMGEASRERIAAWTPETFAENMERAVQLALARAAERKRR
jgi:glycosyltransferase involved in cell wall biosynthesis